jgi:hypothetical protein
MSISGWDVVHPPLASFVVPVFFGEEGNWEEEEDGEVRRN